MAAANPPLDLSASGVISRSVEEIARGLEVLVGRRELLTSDLGSGGLVFTSRLCFVDPGRGYVIFDACADEKANAALLARPRASFRASAAGLHIEFAAAGPQRVLHAGQAAIRFRFPDVLVTQQRRAHERASVQPQVPLHLLIDAGGVISFDGYMVDISAGGIGFLQYASNITVEPGTILKDCRIELPGRAPVMVDLEVRYSGPVALPDGTQGLRSGCRFVNPSPEVKLLLDAFFKR